ncbi:MAG: thiamine phosphate synthase [Myxococcales bacterium]|nr:thiamine phosphate synthase [Myxococcales bacterium]
MTTRAQLARLRGLYGIADAQAARDGDPIGLGLALLRGGCGVLQLRCKGWSPADTLTAARRLATHCREHGTLFIVNDHPEVAAQVDADGVHLGQTDLDTAAARSALGPGRLLGRSTNDLASVPAAVADADYVAFGPVFGTPNLSRPKQVQGLDALRAARELVPRSCPLVAIGGIDAERLADVRATGVDAWAIIGAIARAPDPEAAARSLR